MSIISWLLETRAPSRGELQDQIDTLSQACAIMALTQQKLAGMVIGHSEFIADHEERIDTLFGWTNVKPEESTEHWED